VIAVARGGRAFFAIRDRQHKGSICHDTGFDLIVLGAGSGGNGVARAAAAAGWNVASSDCRPYGGTCALRGCDPKKMLIAVTEGVEWTRAMAGKGLQAQI